MAGAVEPLTDEPVKLEGLASPGCTLEARKPPSSLTPSASERVLQSIKVRVARDAVSGVGEPAIITVRHHTAKFTLATDNTAAAGVVAEIPGVKIAGFVSRNEIPIFIRPSHKIAGGVIITTPQTPLELVGVEANGLRVKLAQSGGLLELASGVGEDSIPCADAGASPFEPPLPQKGKEVELDAKKGLPVSSAPDEAPKATLHVPQANVPLPIEAIELGRKGKFAEVEISGSQAFLTGWVPIASVHKAGPKQFSKLEAIPGAHTKGPQGEPPERPAGFECKSPLDLIVPEHVGEKHKLITIGIIDSGTLILEDLDPKHASPSEGYKAIGFGDVKSNVPLLVRAASFAACTKRL